MVEQDRIKAFINSLDRGNEPYLDELEIIAKQQDVPIIRKDTQALLKFLMVQSKPLNILEVGAATGFSALLMAEYSSPETKITTIEKYEKRIPVARENFIKYDRDNKITLLEGDATEILKALQPGYDFIFMDAAKGQYINFLPDCLRILNKGGLLVSDNCLQDGDVIESRFAVTRRDRTIHARMREYLYELKHNDMLNTVILTVGDGMTLSVKL
ncbi:MULTISPECIES: O-methyltransferase [unclassified Butyrivibrio]|uniref:O-methyltransferase n=1 Tax=unclassified Butyrivibrio TaxID=2639466 RepID=UPI0003B45960|nr:MULTISPECIES: O-methyltransferase [unclassified Butyrivibrio]MBE5837824.1 O-methyltransferase [Butyrivibrio sp.]SEG20886.1 Predicted O-methyltransferase YrrM [Butyrivibrio sp. Su6]